MTGHIVQFYEKESFLSGVVADFLVSGGEGLGPLMKEVPAERKSIDQSQPARELVIRALKKHKEPIAPKLDGRITVLNEPKRSAGGAGQL